MDKELEEFKKSEWYLSRPQVIKDAIEKKPATQLYSLHGHQCYIYSYEEPESGLLEDVTVTITKTGIGEIFPTGMSVFGVKLDDLTKWVNATDN